MFDFGIGYTELVVIAIAAIVVIGPKDLPRVLRSVGKTVTNRCFSLTHASALVEGLTITNGSARTNDCLGGGVYLSAGTLRKNTPPSRPPGWYWTLVWITGMPARRAASSRVCAAARAGSAPA